MYNNIIEGRGLTIKSGCADFINNRIRYVINSSFSSDVKDSTFGRIDNCTIQAGISNCQFKDLNKCVIESGNLVNCVFYSSIDDISISNNNTALYTESTHKRVYVNNEQLQVFVDSENYFKRGMIIMHSGFETPPEGWAVCDGGTYSYYGESITTPDLRDRFIKGVTSINDVKAVDNPDLKNGNEFTITEEHLPEHNHPHKKHTHTISGTSVSIQSSGNLSMSGSYTDATTSVSANITTAVITAEGEGVTSSSADMANGVSESSSSESKTITVSGGDHSHTATVTEGTISETPSEEDTKTWENKAFKIEPNYYSLIFIMKL